MVAEKFDLKIDASPPWRARLLSRPSQVTLDTFVLTAAFGLAYLLRYDFSMPSADLQRMLYQLPFVLALQLFLLWCSGVYTFIWRYVGMNEIKTFLTAALWGALPLIILRMSHHNIETIQH